MKRMLFSGILCVVGLISIIYFIVYMSLVDLTNTFTYFWLLFGGLCLAGGLGIVWLERHAVSLPVWLVRGGLAAAGICAVVFCIAEGVIMGYGWSEPKGGADYIIVLGARVSGTRPTYNLEQRLRVAYRYLSENPDTKAVLSGARGKGEDISEAEAMKNYLVERGIEEGRLLLEDQSYNTDQNLALSREKLASPDASVVIVSNRFHIFRAVRIARKKGMTNVQGMGAPVKWYTVPNMYVREGFAVIKYAVCGQI